MTVANPKYRDLRFDADENRWQAAKAVIGEQRVLAGPQLSQQLLHAPEHLAMVLARYRAAAAMIGTARRVREVGSGEAIGAGILAQGREMYEGFDTDRDAVQIAREQHRGNAVMRFQVHDITQDRAVAGYLDAVVSLDTIEHIPPALEDAFMRGLRGSLYCESGHELCVIGTPNAAFDHLASPQSRAGHINTYTHDRLHALMSKHFRLVQSFGLQDTSLHLGHPDARHYLLMVGIGPKRGA
jgi:2-polyprenyl-3-methyl-5-hydroxy-6-metoxy-1,4-benzoquinol methylase